MTKIVPILLLSLATKYAYGWSALAPRGAPRKFVQKFGPPRQLSLAAPLERGLALPFAASPASSGGSFNPAKALAKVITKLFGAVKTALLFLPMLVAGAIFGGKKEAKGKAVSQDKPNSSALTDTRQVAATAADGGKAALSDKAKEKNLKDLQANKEAAETLISYQTVTEVAAAVKSPTTAAVETPTTDEKIAETKVEKKEAPPVEVKSVKSVSIPEIKTPVNDLKSVPVALDNTSESQETVDLAVPSQDDLKMVFGVTILALVIGSLAQV